MLPLVMVGAGAPPGAASRPGTRDLPANVDPWRAAVDTQEADCRGSERVAARRLAQRRAGQDGGALRASDEGWEERYGRCPFAPHVGTLGLMEAWGRAETLPYGFEADGLDEFVATRTRKRRRLMAWSARVRAEFTRRGVPAPAPVFLVWAGASLAVTDIKGATRILHEGVEAGAVGAADTRWLHAVASLITLRHAEGLEALGAPVLGSDRTGSAANTRTVYLRAVFLDRLGDRDGAAAAMRAAQTADKDLRALRGLVRALPAHEALYVRALSRQFSGRGEALTLRLWAAYLSRPEPEAPERALAERHRNSLAPRPASPR